MSNERRTWEGSFTQAIAMMRQGAYDIESLTLKTAPIPTTQDHVRHMTHRRHLDLMMDALDALADALANIENLSTYHHVDAYRRDADDLAAARTSIRHAGLALSALTTRRATTRRLGVQR